ncbi:hypothetical protein BH11PLA2_BH11PLA2_51020 [soil metagenome]
MNLPAEVVETLAANKHVRIERIVSTGQASLEGFWYDQAWDEWVLLLKRAAKLQLEKDSESITMKPADAITILAHTRHRVEWTTPDESTIWLAVHFDNQQ